MKKVYLSLLLVVVGAGCSAKKWGGDTKLSAEAWQPNDVEDTNPPGLSLQWSASNDPVKLGDNLNYTYDQLPTSGEVEVTPWPGSYWAVYRDSINYKWDGAGSVSAPMKYKRAFRSTSDIESLVSARSGIDHAWGRKSCTTSADCSAGSSCARRSNATGQCIPTWWGICDAWSLAAVNTPEPKHSVTYNGIEFKIADIKALVTYSYTSGVSRIQLADRCNTAAENLSYDTAGSAETAACADTNAGTFHMMVANMIGIQKKAFIEDRQWDYQVWNQPVRKFKTTLDEEVTPLKANQLTGYFEATTTVDSKKDSIAANEWKAVGKYNLAAWTALTVEMTGTGDADLYVKMGAVPTKTSYDCRPYKSSSNEKCLISGQGEARVAYVYVRGYSATATYTVTLKKSAQSSTYTRNPNATSLRHVKMSLYYVNEPASLSNEYLTSVIDEYTTEERYEYIVEISSEGKIIGGEWVGTSKTSHPDFLWIGTDKAATTVSGISWSNVKKLMEAASK